MMDRRTLLGSGTGIGAVALVPVAILPADDDAALIRLSAEHVANFAAYDAHGGAGPLDAPDLLWDAYERTRNAISAARPRTLAGVLAKARAAKAEAQRSDGGENPDGTMAQVWAWDLVNDLLAGSAGT